MNQVRIGVTGGIGSGKSYVCDLLARRGIPVYNCDNEAKRLMAESETLMQRITKLVGDDAYVFSKENNRWTFNKQAVAAYLFCDEKHAQAINTAVHPAVKDDFIRWADSQTSSIVAQECALLFEAGFDSVVDKTIEVYAPRQLRLQRAMKRDSATASQIEARMNKQMPEEDKRCKADFCIVNDGTSDVEEQIDTIINKLKEHTNNQVHNNKQTK